MIYGFFSNDNSVENIKKKVKLLEQLMFFENCNKKKYNFTHFQLGYITSNHFYSDRSDFFFSENKTNNCVLFSGSIYNRPQILAQLHLTEGSVSNSELVYWLYKQKGEEFVNQLNGDFVIALYDWNNEFFLLYRDHLGVHPLAYTVENDCIVFSSDILSLCQIFHLEENINADFLLKQFKMVDFNKLPTSNVKKLLPGHYLKFHSGNIKITKYWFPEKIKVDKFLKKEDMLKEAECLIKKAVRIRSNTNVLAASHVTGGLDSGIVAAFVRKVYSKQPVFYGFSWSPERANTEKLEFDERELVREQCAMNNIEPVFTQLSKSDYKLFSSNPLKYSIFFEENKVREEAKKRNVRLIFSGHGGDEFISAGNRGILTDLLLGFHWRSFFKIYPITLLKPLGREIIYDIIMPYLGILPFPVRKAQNEQTFYIKNKFKHPNSDVIRKFYFYKNRKQLQLGYLYCYYLPDRMEDWFIKGIHAGLKYRYPLLDKEIVEFILKVPSSLLIKGVFTRSIIREISEGLLPEKIRWKGSGMDPAFHNMAKKKMIDYGLNNINEIDKIKTNPELIFIDFEKMIDDIQKFKQNPDTKKYEKLIFAVSDVIHLHKFTLKYKKRITDGSQI